MEKLIWLALFNICAICAGMVGGFTGFATFLLLVAAGSAINLSLSKS